VDNRELARSKSVRGPFSQRLPGGRRREAPTLVRFKPQKQTFTDRSRASALGQQRTWELALSSSRMSLGCVAFHSAIAWGTVKATQRSRSFSQHVISYFPSGDICRSQCCWPQWHRLWCHARCCKSPAWLSCCLGALKLTLPTMTSPLN
jgi:hypothetical protein